MADAEFLRQEGGDDLAVEQVKDDWRQMELSEAEYSMLEYAEKLTLTPSNMREAGVQKLRNAGCTIATSSTSSMSAPTSTFVCA